MLDILKILLFLFLHARQLQKQTVKIMEAITVSKLLDLANIPADRHGALRRWLNGDKVVRVSTEEVLAVSTAAASIAQAVVEHINSLTKQ